MAPGVSQWNRLKGEVLTYRPELVERVAWGQTFVSTLTQLSGEASFPSYNVVLGFWGLYVAFTRSFQACNAYMWFLSGSVLLDIIYCSVWGSNDAGIFKGPTAKFCLAMLIINMFIKAASLCVFRQLHKTLVVELTDRATQQGLRRASINLALKQARKEGGRGSVSNEKGAADRGSKRSKSRHSYEEAQQQTPPPGGYETDQNGMHDRTPLSSPGSSLMLSRDQSPDAQQQRT